METAVHAWTEGELMSLPKDGHKRELIEGEIIMSPTGYRHEDIAAAVLTALRLHVRQHKLGSVCGSSLGCWMVTGNLLSPDVSYIHRSRIPRGKDAVQRYFQGAPDLIVEILSPWDRTVRTHDKLVEYFASGARLGWVIDPEKQLALAYRAPDAGRVIGLEDALDGEDVLPGFRLPLAELFAEPLVE
ncbi:MAG: Uma2 family endonuclease [Verrucomicrobia bacterium]|nr:Uma2 family endonuclease [Verrucomicrobiota bacterium]